jgi:hypothetical protein
MTKSKLVPFIKQSIGGNVVYVLKKSSNSSYSGTTTGVTPSKYISYLTEHIGTLKHSEIPKLIIRPPFLDPGVLKGIKDHLNDAFNDVKSGMQTAGGSSFDGLLMVVANAISFFGPTWISPFNMLFQNIFSSDDDGPPDYAGEKTRRLESILKAISGSGPFIPW